jgi:hypothetical protein
MQKILFISLLILCPSCGFSQDAQEASVEKSVFGIQIGLLGVWAHNELRLSNQVALRSEIGLSGPNTCNIKPMLALEPRWYYNLNKRVEKGKRIDGNSGDYVSLRTSYHFHDISDPETSSGLDNLLIIPSWGMRRNIGNHFNYEAGIGVGLGISRDTKIKVGLTTNVILKIGYRF